MTHTYSIKGMTCNSCVAKVKSAFLKLGDVQDADVQLAFPQAIITMSKHIATGALQTAIGKAGNYTIEEIAQQTSHHSSNEAISENEGSSYLPIVLIFAYITGATLLIQLVNGTFEIMLWMRHFMAAFFLVFSFFKLMNLRGFAEGYSTYDIVAKRFYTWGFIYPFIELALVLALLIDFAPLLTNIIAFAVMGISSIGVIESLLNKRPFQCACLGTICKLPLSKVTLFEDLLMVAMSAAGVFMML